MKSLRISKGTFLLQSHNHFICYSLLPMGRIEPLNLSFTYWWLFLIGRPPRYSVSTNLLNQRIEFVFDFLLWNNSTTNTVNWVVLHGVNRILIIRTAKDHPVRFTIHWIKEQSFFSKKLKRNNSGTLYSMDMVGFTWCKQDTDN